MQTNAAMKILNHLVFAALLFPVLLEAQIPFEQAYRGEGSDEGVAFAEMSNGDFVLGGATSFFIHGPTARMIMRTNAQGDSLWSYHAHSEGEIAAIRELHDGRILVYGSYDDFDWGPARGNYLFCLDANGDSLWFERMDSTDVALDLVVPAQDRYLLVSGRHILMLNEQLDTLWVKPTDTAFHQVVVPAQGEIVLAASREFVPQEFLTLTRLNLQGDTLASKTYPRFTNPLSFATTNDNGYIIQGWQYSVNAGTVPELVRLDSNFDTLWVKQLLDYPMINYRANHTIAQAADGGFFLCGATEDNKGVLTKTDAQGRVLWSSTNTAHPYSHYNALSVDATGNVCLLGSVIRDSAPEFSWDLYFRKTGSWAIGIDPSSASEEHLLVYPNPFSQSTTMQWNGPLKQNLRIEVVDLQGQLLHQMDFPKSGRLQFDREGLPSGLYLYRVLGVGTKPQVGKLIVE